MSVYYFEDASGHVRECERIVGDDQARGECSGIPPCCVEFYVTTWIDLCDRVKPWNDNVAGAARPSRVDRDVYDFHMSQPCEYISCPQCIERKNFVEVKSCSDNDGRDCTCGMWARSKVVS